VDQPTMRARVRRDLRDEDVAGQRWSDDELDRHLARAVAEASLAAPREATATLSAPGGSRDLDIATLTGRVSLDAVEYPSGRFPPSFVAFSSWGDTLTLLLPGAPAAGEPVVVRYGAVHTLDDAGSSLPPALEEAVATGAGAYAALEWASYATNRINVGGEDAARDYHDWAQERLAAFQGMLARQGRTRRLHSRRLYEPLPAALGPRPLGE
jgi:hypothetical protein